MYTYYFLNHYYINVIMWIDNTFLIKKKKINVLESFYDKSTLIRDDSYLFYTLYIIKY